MADAGDDEDLFADLYDDNAEDSAPAPAAPTKTEPAAAQAPTGDDFEQPEPVIASGSINTGEAQNDTSFDTPQGMGGMDGYQDGGGYQDSRHEERPIGTKEDGKMFIGGLNWETTDESLKNYFSQFGEVIECTVMRDGATGRSRGFGFLTLKDPKTVNTVMVKEHQLDGKLIDPKRAIPRDEQERTAKIFVGGVSQDATESDFKEFFMKFGRVLDATLMMDKDTGRPRGFGFVTFDNDMAVERTLEGPLSILGKPIEVKRAQPRGKMGEEEPQHNKFGRGGKGQGWGNNGGGNGGFNPNQMAQGGGDAGGGANSGMTPAMMAQYWQRMQQYFAMMQGMQANTMTPQMMNPQMMANPMVQQMMAQRNMNPQMMQQMMMQQQQGGQQGSAGGQSPMNNGSGSPGPGGQQRGGGFNAQEQMMFEQQKYEQQQRARMMMAQNGAGGNAWDGMYDDEPQPQGMGPQGGNMRGGYRGGRGGGGGGGFSRGGSGPPAQAPNAPANAPTGPKNAGKPGANYRGGGRGGHRGGFHPYARGGG